mmetsp:Transcript_12652/g.29714  ORF Transcript_12652/g.29714 Transcript_12652/m.29714 type:complete len:213 (+) Transcript_12652:605-1243(+)
MHSPWFAKHSGRPKGPSSNCATSIWPASCCAVNNLCTAKGPKSAVGMVFTPSQPTVSVAKWKYELQFENALTMRPPPCSTHTRNAASSSADSGGPSVVQSRRTSNFMSSSACSASNSTCLKSKWRRSVASNTSNPPPESCEEPERWPKLPSRNGNRVRAATHGQRWKALPVARARQPPQPGSQAQTRPLRRAANHTKRCMLKHCFRSSAACS